MNPAPVKRAILKLGMVVLLSTTTLLNAMSAGPWQNIRFSGKTAANLSYLRTKINLPNQTTNKLIYHNGTALIETDQSLFNGTTGTYQTAFPVTTSREYLGLRTAAGTNPAGLIPVFL